MKTALQVLERFVVDRRPFAPRADGFVIILGGVPLHMVRDSDGDAYDKTQGALIRYATAVYNAIEEREGPLPIEVTRMLMAKMEATLK